MASELSLRPVTPELRAVLEQLWQLYRHDLSDFRGSLPGHDGRFHTRTLDPFLRDDPELRAYLFERDGGPVGFALVSRVTSEPRLMSEFFVVRAARGQGVGRAAADALFALHPGTWEIPFQEENGAAARFWRRVAARAAQTASTRSCVPFPASRTSRRTSGSP